VSVETNIQSRRTNKFVRITTRRHQDLSRERGIAELDAPPPIAEGDARGPKMG
jgi:hypothetical protein